MLLLPSRSQAQPLDDDDLADRPSIDYPALFKAYISMGNAVFGNWIPDGYIEEVAKASSKRQFEYTD
ncbi:uncharacterized protein [Drosophila tropicalis]|uniref:uncharacterized protein n=1 Tax=Drosophila tropicalis TaxID=46794 RepID=UPI0035ABF205